jgi:hypothetical protein
MTIERVEWDEYDYANGTVARKRGTVIKWEVVDEYTAVAIIRTDDKRYTVRDVRDLKHIGYGNPL